MKIRIPTIISFELNEDACKIILLAYLLIICIIIRWVWHFSIKDPYKGPVRSAMPSKTKINKCVTRQLKHTLNIIYLSVNSDSFVLGFADNPLRGFARAVRHFCLREPTWNSVRVMWVSSMITEPSFTLVLVCGLKKGAYDNMDWSCSVSKYLAWKAFCAAFFLPVRGDVTSVWESVRNHVIVIVKWIKSYGRFLASFLHWLATIDLIIVW